MTKPYAIAAVVFVVLVIATTAYFAHVRVVKAERLDNLRTQLASASAAYRKFIALDSWITHLADQASIPYHTAIEAGQKRHDDSLSGNSDTSYEFKEATIEQDAVSQVSQLEDQIHDSHLHLEQLVNTALGSSQIIDKYKADESSRHEAVSISMNNWERAISDVRDSLKTELNGDIASDNSSDVDHFYAASDDAGTKANVIGGSVADDLAAIQKTMMQRIENIKQDIAAVESN